MISASNVNFLSVLAALQQRILIVSHWLTRQSANLVRQQTVFSKLTKLWVVSLKLNLVRLSTKPTSSQISAHWRTYCLCVKIPSAHSLVKKEKQLRWSESNFWYCPQRFLLCSRCNLDDVYLFPFEWKFEIMADLKLINANS